MDTVSVKSPATKFKGISFIVLGFLSISDVSSPPVVSRHLVLPHLVVKDDISPTNGGTDEESRQATLCVFLHGALKVENMCALVQVTNVDNCKDCV